ncbi:MAG: hypothetical protein UR66_C0009G0150 [Candidatus Moranbacteria bacterium GW2011_GWE1_35_17]|nr:MAG: hypothetical protein UR66_C0009G0150 [Candidatus Moranbacteria bacterium GW2011_GWE1_35_17]KKP73003.1 MAG: hypothetical protein UR65_C0009G0007 [Candidatus Moranbacteria bacterium GW2011_GWE2_35_164]KKP84723.1 MAG: hypothetical protein UR83_C0014G0026 [Candidatus Moranbacteria bacterium GW2011_GWF2_35_54]
MKIKLSLLPKSKEKRIKNNKILKFVILQEIMIIVITLLFFGAIKGVDAVAKYQLSSINQQLASKELNENYIEIKKYEENLKEAGAKVGFIKNIQNFDINWVFVLNKLSLLLPTEVVLNSMSGNGLNLTLKGIAQDRDILIKMKEDIQSDNCFEGVNIPLNNIVLKENIEFELKFVVNIKCLNGHEKK